MKKIIIFMMMLLMMVPALAGASGSYAAGDLSLTAVSDSLEDGNQVWFRLNFEGDATDETSSPRELGLSDLISRVSAEGKAYLEEGRLHLTASVNLDSVQVMDMTAVRQEDGSIHFATSLTGENIFVIPAELVQSDLTIEDFMYSAFSEIDLNADFNSLSAAERLRESGSNVLVTLMRTLLGWVSTNQIDLDGEFYVFDTTYIEPTETRDGVAQRMIGTIMADQMGALFWDITSLLDAEAGEFQQALADVLAEHGVTRSQVRYVIDRLLPDIPIDAATDFVQMTHSIKDGNAPCKYDDISYVFKKLVKFSDKIWEESLDEPLSLIVSYDDYGTMVGMDAVLPKFTENLPLEGTFTYSLHTDDDWQVLTTSHGELKITDDEDWIEGDYQHLNGEDVDGINANSLSAYLVLQNRNTDESIGGEIEGEWVYSVQADEDYNYTEAISGEGGIGLVSNGVTVIALTGEMSSKTVTNGEVFNFIASGAACLEDWYTVGFSAEMGQEEIETITLPEGDEILLNQLDEETLHDLKTTIKTNVIGAGLKALTVPEILRDMQLISGAGD